MKRLSMLLVATLPCWPEAPLHAASVFRCSDAEGNVSFNQYGCPPGSQTEQQRTRTPNLLNSEPLRKEPDDRSFPIHHRENAQHTQEIVVVGERDEVCGKLISAQERRQAIIRKQVRSGMTRADVESALGKPDRVSGRNGQVRYHYQPKQGARHLVQFDETGCVKGGR
ncbi:DUF4124 domain-containing protein [Pseudomonas sp. Q1-7]|uniref:DUF4124 domain-containing protein n=1 Tax=Pseudomonas sp. Q1-7 TaxID=3020843 RepID=UPI0022FFCA91|nr:DUF4124 domain-containing protein [Pseudomonas sp. Q1-7]